MRGMIRLLVVFGLAGIFTNISSLVYAGEWDRAVGPARTVENAARDLRRRMERVISNRYSIEQAVRLERTAGEMVNLLQINSSRPGEVSHLLNELEGLHARVQSVVLIETNRRNDHALRAQADHLARRMTELRLALRRVSVDPLDCGVAGGLPYSSRYGDRDLIHVMTLGTIHVLIHASIHDQETTGIVTMMIHGETKHATIARLQADMATMVVTTSDPTATDFKVRFKPEMVVTRSVSVDNCRKK